VDQVRLTLSAAVYKPKFNKRTNETEKQPRDLMVTLDYEGERAYKRAVLEVPDFNKALHVGSAEARGDSVRLSVVLGTDRRAEGGDGKFELKLRRQGSKVTGTYAGTYRGEKCAGEVSGEFKSNVLSDQGHWDATVQPPAMKAIPGGVEVGGDRIVFAGGMDDDDATTYLTVQRGAQTAVELTGEDVDLERFQGEIGLYVPDTGYPFGRIPDWLIRQRVQRDEERGDEDL
jgi:hypothetical protein